jgi:ferric-dicitrate binding protein FerR (iron transport regulator)
VAGARGPAEWRPAIHAGVLALRRRLESVISRFGRAYEHRFAAVAIGGDVPDPRVDPGVLLEGYLVGELSADDRARFEHWMAEDEERGAVVAALRERIGRGTGAQPWDEPVDVEGWWAECGAKVHTGEGGRLRDTHELRLRPAGPRLGPTVPSPSGWWGTTVTWSGAAAIVICAAWGAWAAHAGRGDTGRAGQRAEHAYVTSRGERAVVTLDGARVVLGPESVLRIAGGYGIRDRTVSLVGRAYFDVAHDDRRPFRVWAGGVVAEDIGTRFDVRAYAGDSTTRLVVADGAVAIRSGATGGRIAGPPVPAVVVSRGMMATAGVDGVVRVRSGVAADRYTSWSDGRLVFENTPLADVLVELGRWYDLEIRMGDPRLGSKSLTATVDDDPAAATLVALEGALDVRAVRVGRVVTLYPP